MWRERQTDRQREREIISIYYSNFILVNYHLQFLVLLFSSKKKILLPTSGYIPYYTLCFKTSTSHRVQVESVLVTGKFHNKNKKWYKINTTRKLYGRLLWWWFLFWIILVKKYASYLDLGFSLMLKVNRDSGSKWIKCISESDTSKEWGF